jgi:hypothetical protein
MSTDIDGRSIGQKLGIALGENKLNRRPTTNSVLAAVVSRAVLLAALLQHTQNRRLGAFADRFRQNNFRLHF